MIGNLTVVEKDINAISIQTETYTPPNLKWRRIINLEYPTDIVGR